MSIFDDFGKSLSQLGDPRFMSVVLKAIGLTLATLILVSIVFVWTLGLFLPETLTLPWIGEISFVASVVSIAAIFLMFGLSIFLMIPVASLIVGFLAEDIADAVEDKHYPGLPDVGRLSWSEIFGDSLKFLGLVILANLVALVFYLFTAVFAPLVFWAVNGLLLGSEYFHLVAARRLGSAGARALRRKHFGHIWMAGFLMAIPLSIPVLSLLVPVLGVATFTHIFHRVNTSA